MLTLLLMRHAKSSWEDSHTSDHERPLNARGLRAAPRMGRLLSDAGLVPELIVSSTARRAVETAEAVVRSSRYDGRLETSRRLYLAEPEGYLEELAKLAEGRRRVLMIGHNPGLAQLVWLLAGANEAMPTAAIAHLELPTESFSEVRPGSATLRAVYRPKDLDPASFQAS